MSLTDQEILARLAMTEDAFVERKSRSDHGDWLKTTVAFANSVPIGSPAVLFIGVADDGTIIPNGKIGDTMKSYSDLIARSVYPPLYTDQRIISADGVECIAVIIQGSAARPHFAGRAYVRSGTQTLDASAEQFDELIASRTSKARFLLASKGELVTHEVIRMKGTPHTNRGASYWIVEDCNQFFVTLRHSSRDNNARRSLPLETLQISRDNDRGCLKVVTEE